MALGRIVLNYGVLEGIKTISFLEVGMVDGVTAKLESRGRVSICFSASIRTVLYGNVW